jgi:hypothetical protein
MSMADNYPHRHRHRQPSHRLPLLATLAIIGQLVFAASALLLPIWSEYRLVGDNISELALGRYGIVQSAAFLSVGLGTLGLAFTIGQITVGSRGSLVGSLLVAVYGAEAILCHLHPTQRLPAN